MSARLLSEIMGRHAGKPIVVMGGGPSLPMDVEQVKRAGCWISANEHGVKLRGADYIVAVDERHQRERKDMRDVLRPLGVPIISQRFIGDYRIPEWDRHRFMGNSGLHSILIAWLLGGHPIIPCGIELYRGGVYWHDEEAPTSGKRKPAGFFERLLDELRGIIGDAAVRPVSGPLLAWWPKGYRPTEQLPKYKEPPEVARIRGLTGSRYRWRRNSPWIGMTKFRRGEECVLTGWEAAQHIRSGALDPVSVAA